MKKLSFLAVILALVLTSQTFATQIIKVEDVKIGMWGYGLTTFNGYIPQRFEAKVIGIDSMYQGLVKTPVVYVKFYGGPVNFPMQHVGVAEGMSGSPIYLYTKDGVKLLGALAYGGYFDKDPIAGVQPAEEMLKNGEKQAVSRMCHLDEESRILVMFNGPFSVSKNLKNWTENRGLELKSRVQTSAGSGDNSEEAKMRPGATINVFIVQGDIEMYANGTVTMVDGKTFYGFGHPFFNVGQTSLPVTLPRMMWTMANYMASYKMPSGGGKPIGTIIQDNWSGIKGTIGGKADMISLGFKLKGAGQERSLNCEVARVPGLTNDILATLIYYTLTGACQEFNLTGKNRATVILRLKTTSGKQVDVAPYICNFSEESNDAFASYVGNLQENVLSLLTENQVSLKSVEVEVVYESYPEDRYLELTKAYFDKSEAQSGETLILKLVLQLKNQEKKNFQTEVPFVIPYDIDTGTVTVAVGSRDNLRLPNKEKMTEKDVLTLVSSFTNATLLVAADFSRLETVSSNSDNDSTVVTKNVKWTVIPGTEKEAKTFLVLRTVPLPVQEILNGSQILTIRVTKGKVQPVKKETGKTKKGKK